MERNRSEKFQQSIRSEDGIRLLFRKAIEQAVDVFNESLRIEEKNQLLGLAQETGTVPLGIIHGLRILAKDSKRVDCVAVVNNILLTINENLTEAEREQFNRSGQNLLESV